MTNDMATPPIDPALERSLASLFATIEKRKQDDRKRQEDTKLATMKRQGIKLWWQDESETEMTE